MDRYERENQLIMEKMEIGRLLKDTEACVVTLHTEVERKESTILDLVAVSMNVSKELLEAEAENKRLLEKVTELRTNIHENGNKAQVIMAGEVLEMRKNTARKCAEIAQDGVTARYIREEINDKFGLTKEVSND